MPDKAYSFNDISFVWDEDKNLANKKKHGIDFETAALVFNDMYRVEFSDSFHGDEIRYNTIGEVNQVLFVVYVDRMNFRTHKTDIRIISARMANSFEKKMYYDAISGTM